MNCTITGPFYLELKNGRSIFLWIITDLMPNLTVKCEIMAKLACNASLLKDHDYRLKCKSFTHKVGSYLGIWEDENHIVMQCSYFEGTRKEMLDVINAINDERIYHILANPQNIFEILMGKHPEGAHFEIMLK